MRLGFTYDLRIDYLAAGYSEEETAEFDSPATIDALAGALQSLGHDVDRIGNVRQLTQRLAAGDSWDGVFNICEGLRGVAREAQVPAVLDAYEIPYTFSDPLVMALCLHKGLTKSVVQPAGVPTPRFHVCHTAADCRAEQWRYPLFAKPVAEGTGKGVTPASKITSASELETVCQLLLDRFQQPVLVEEFLPGREFTVGLIGTGDAARVLGTLEIILLPGAEADVYSYVNKEQCEQLVEYRLVHAERDAEVRRAEQIALTAWRTLNCRDAGRVDLRSDAQGQPNFLEVNPLAGLHPTHSDLPMLATAVGMSYLELIEQIVASASRRWAQHERCCAI